MQVAVIEFLRQITETYNFPMNPVLFQVRLGEYIECVRKLTGIQPILKADQRTGKIEIADLQFSSQCRFKEVLSKMNSTYGRIPIGLISGTSTIQFVKNQFSAEIEKNSGLKVEPVFEFQPNGIVNVEDVLAEVIAK